LRIAEIVSVQSQPKLEIFARLDATPESFATLFPFLYSPFVPAKALRSLITPQVSKAYPPSPNRRYRVAIKLPI
jgi:hypothetical protein